MASTDTIPDAPARELVLFRVAGRVHGIDLHTIREIIPARRTTRLPGAPDYVAGLMNVRGTIVTVIDLGAHLASAPVGSGAQVILVEEGARLVGIAVDEVTEVLRLEPSQVEPAPPEQTEGGVVAGLGHSGDSVVILLDIRAIIQHVLL